MPEATHKPSKVAATKDFSSVSMLLIQAVTMFTIPCDSQKKLFFINFIVILRCFQQLCCLETVVQRWSTKKIFLNILQNLRENTSAGLSFSKICRSPVCDFFKKETPITTINFYEKYCCPVITWNKKHLSKQCVSIANSIQTREKNFAAITFEGLWNCFFSERVRKT